LKRRLFTIELAGVELDGRSRVGCVEVKVVKVCELG